MWQVCYGLSDDIIIFSNNEIEHLQHIEEIFNRLECFGIKMKKEKCDFFKRHIQYLGHLLVKEGFTPLPEKLILVILVRCQGQKYLRR